jgi:transcriptional regulator with XRE-family HTH domain
MQDDLTFGEYVRRLRRKKRWDLQTLGQASGLSPTHLSRIENDNAVPNVESVVKLANALDGDLDLMVQLAECLPREILERLVRRADEGAPTVRRAAGAPGIDPGYPAALLGEVDPRLREVLAEQFGLSPDDISGIFLVLQRMAQMSPDERRTVIDFLATAAGGERS